ncbi:MAG: tolB protein precursor protein [Deltaproteobacteria bacterium]|nr:tolB protein precursor protein [Deltaproteobacteria bacterium]
MKRASILLFLPLSLVLLWPVEAAGQVFVYPRRPDKSLVRHFDFDWQHSDLIIDVDLTKPEGEEKQEEGDEEKVEEAPDAVPVSEGSGGEEGEDGKGDGDGNGDAPVEAEVSGAGSGRTLKAAVTPADGAEGEPNAPAPAPAPVAEPAPPTVVVDAPKPEGTDGAVAPPARPVPQKHPDAGARAVAGLGKPADRGAKPEDAASQLRGAGRVRLYFYEREREVAERASVLVEGSYRYLSERFDFIPREQIPFILYSSYQEFLQTNLFPLQEGVLGVTSPRDLKMTLPYFGDHRLFDEVGTHEMAHQFTIQKVRAVAKQADLWGDPLENMPLWFIEGLAEYYAQRGVDPEAEMLVRDILVNPSFQRGYAMLGFFEDRPYSVLWTYKVGQVRCAFLEDHYGAGTIQKILDRSPRLVGAYEGQRQVDGFARLIEELTGDEPRKVAAAFSDWLKRRAFPSYLDSAIGEAELEPLKIGLENVDALAASPDGQLVLLRSMDGDTGRSRLTLLDPRAPNLSRTVVADGVPGAESLHPVSGRNFDVRADGITYVAQVRGRDHLYWRPLVHLAKERTARPGQPTEGRGASLHEPGSWTTKLELGSRVSLPLPEGILAVGSPAFSPDGRRIVFIALNEAGQKDVYVVDVHDGKPARALTDDLWAEREVSWGLAGIVYTSDATETGHYNLFSVAPEGGEPTRLTFEARDAQDIKVLPDGRIVYVAFDQARADIYEVSAAGVRALTLMDTGVFDPSPAGKGDLWVLWHNAGQRIPVKLPASALTPAEPTAPAEAGRPRTLASQPLVGATPYDPLRPRNWELGNLFGLFGAGGSGVFGQLMASGSDKLRNHAVLLNLFIFGSFDLTDGFAVYVNQAGRMTWGTGVFQSLLFRTDQTPGIADLGVQVTTAERYYGALGSLRYPFDTYHHVQGDLSIGGTTYFLLEDAELILGDGELNGTHRNLLQLWRDANEGARLQGEVTLRYGYDTIRYHRATGPLAGSSLMLESTTTVQPLDGELFGNVRVDAEKYLPLWGRANVFLRVGAGTAFGSRFARQFYLSSFDTLRGVPFGDADFLRGQHFAYGTLELQFPLNAIVRLILFTDIEGVLGVDFGAVGNELSELWNKRVLDVVLGVNFGFGPLVFRLHFAKPVDVGANPTLVGVERGLPNNGQWVTNFSLGWVYF